MQREQELCPLDSLITEAQRREWQTHAKKPQPASKDTVGCVALDARGLIAAATSTGGIALNYYSAGGAFQELTFMAGVLYKI